MLDKYWLGDSTRMSPEAPVPIVKIEEIDHRLGGASNVALNIKKSGVDVRLFGIVGNDQNAIILNNLIKKNNIENSLIKSKQNTITKLRVMSKNKQMLRMDFEEKYSLVQSDKLLKNFEKMKNDSGLLILSDYNKGTLDVKKWIAISKEKKLQVIVDPKGNDFSKYKGIYCLTPNFKEFQEVVGNIDSDRELDEKAHNLVKKLKLNFLLITRSENGISVYEKNYKSYHFPSETKEVIDVTGAGDTVIAILASMLARGKSFVEACKLSNRAAGIVVSKLGTSYLDQKYLQKLFDN